MNICQVVNFSHLRVCWRRHKIFFIEKKTFFIVCFASEPRCIRVLLSWRAIRKLTLFSTL